MGTLVSGGTPTFVEIFADVTSTLSHTDNTRKQSATPSDFLIFFKDVRVAVSSDFNPVALSGRMKVSQEL